MNTDHLLTACTFCGHSRLYGSADYLKVQLQNTVQHLIEVEQFNCFLVGDYGDFDYMAASVCLDAKKQYPYIVVDLVIPYYRPHLDEYDKKRYSCFDNVIVPELEETPYQYRIIKANQYMVDSAAALVAFVSTSYGGAAKTLKYAQGKKKRIIFLQES